jgi:hypothetical protein
MRGLTNVRRSAMMVLVLRARPLMLLLAVPLTAAACGSDDAGGGGAATTSPSPRAQVQAIVASVDHYVGAPQRVAVGLVTNENELVSYGSVELSFAFIGTAAEPSEPQAGPSSTARFIPTYGTDAEGDGPAITLPSEARGVYEARDVEFDRAGFWQVTVTAEVQGVGTQQALATLAVAEEPGIPAPGDPALETENLTLDSKGVPEAAIDSRFVTDGEIPDPELHGWTIARALEEGRPALVVFGTPVYCVSQFCGPVTDMVQDLSHRYEDRAVFIHVEIWEDYETQAVNQAALDWLQQPSGDLTEPWLYLIGPDGTIADRWSTLWSEDEVAAELERLPPMRR